ncbi:MAG: hypothetical protein B7C24_08440 [Bacteroidetes bacterium 4572_77]|nr:MAG: hypothetical protein B7C24_08440 [Bacteroidetes bacterium 4572_77]
MIKPFLYRILKIVLVFFMSALLLLGVFKNSMVQSLAGQLGSSILSEKLGVEVWVDKIKISSYFNILLENIHLYDHQQQPLITAKSIQLYYNVFKPYVNEFPIQQLIIDSAFVNLVQYEGDSILNINKILVSDTPTNGIKDSLSPTNKPIKLALQYLQLTNSRFVYHIMRNLPYETNAMDYAYLDIKDINLKIKDAHLKNDSIWGKVLQLQAKDRCGIQLNAFEAEAMVSPTAISLKNAYLITPNSYVRFDLGFQYDSWWDYLDFINKVNMDVQVSSAKVNMKDIAFFASPMYGMDNIVRINGHVKGPVRHLKGTNLDISYGKYTNFIGDLQMTGLPNIYETFIKMNVNQFSTHFTDLKRFKLSDGEQLEMIPDAIKKLGQIRLNGSFVGFYNDFVSNSNFITGIGSLGTKVQFTNNREENIVYYKGDFKAKKFDVGKFLEIDEDFGSINFNLKANGKGLDMASMEAYVNGDIEGLEYNANVLDTIFVDAFIKEKEFEGALDIKDKLIEARFLGNINFDTLIPYFDFNAQFSHVRLAMLGLLPIDSSASLSSKVHMNFTGDNVDSFLGKIKIDSTSLTYKDQVYKMDSMQIIAKKHDTGSLQKSIRISSDYLNGKITGMYQLQLIPEAVQDYIHHYITQFQGVEEANENRMNQKISFDFILRNTRSLEELFIPSLSIKDSLIIKGEVDGQAHKIAIQVNTNEFQWDGISFQSPNYQLSSDTNYINSHLYIQELVLKKPSASDSLRIAFDSLQFDASLFNDSLDLALNWHNKDQIKNNGDINAWFKFKTKAGYNAGFKPSSMFINNYLWNFSDKGLLKVDSTQYYFDNIYLYGDDQSLKFNGAISKNIDSSLLISFKNFNVSSLDILSQQKGLDFDGFLSGDLEIIDVYRQMNFLTDLKIEQFYLNSEDLGRAEIRATRNKDKSIYLNVDLEKQGDKKKFNPLLLEGYYYPQSKKNQLDMNLSIYSFRLNFLHAFLSEYATNIDGRATGEVDISGRLDSLNIAGDMDLMRTQFRINYLNTLYSLSGKLHLDNNNIGFEQVTLYDSTGAQASLRGGLTHHGLRNFGVDLKVNAQEFIGLNTYKGMNEIFYGTAVVTGDISIKGPFDNVFLDINANSKRGTNINIPISTTSDVSENNFIVFVNETDSVEKVEKKYTPKLASFSLNMDLEVTPDARIQLSLPEEMGSIEAEGAGDLNMNMSRTGNFTMAGDYRVNKGFFFFKIGNLLNRKFTLNEGGSISWTGDPYSGVLNMSANYQVKTSLSSLGLEQDSSYQTRIPVNCIVGLTGPVMNPNIKFRFEFPNATEDIKQYVFSKIDTTNAAVMSQQMLSLLVLNSFSFTGTSSGGNIVNSVGESSFQIVANQLSNWLSQISKDVDIGINYRPGGDLTSDEVEVALSTQLFDDRVTIDGNFGYQNVQDNPQSNTSAIVGDINVEVKITKDGRLRLKAFNRTNTVDLMDNTSPYTQGVGIFYRKEFNHIKELFQNTHKKKKDSEKKKLLQENLEAKKEKETLIPEND